MRLRGGVAQLLREEDPRTFAEEGLPCGNGLLQLLQIGGVQEMEEREGGRESITTPAAAAVNTSVLVPGRGGGGGDDDNDVVAPIRIPDLGFNGGDRSGGRPPRGLDCGLGYHPCRAVLI